MYQEEATWDPQMGWVLNDMAGQFQTSHIQNEIRSHQPETSQAQSLMSVPNSSQPDSQDHVYTGISHPSRSVYGIPLAHPLPVSANYNTQLINSWSIPNYMSNVGSFEIPVPNQNSSKNYRAQNMPNSNANPVTNKIHTYRRLPVGCLCVEHPTYSMATNSSETVYYNYTSSTRESRCTCPPAKFECVACRVRFTCESSAKRHQENQVKRFRCDVCRQMFARLDYRNWHQRRCQG